jgi:DNA (cytosine-5)-methyltransferase 3A
VNVLSLFDGMSCGQIALNRLGVNVENYYASEIDKYAIKITQKNYPILNDIKCWVTVGQ